MRKLIVDASALTAMYVSDDLRGRRIRGRLSVGGELFAPAHIDVEVASALRGLAQRHPGVVTIAPTALEHLAGYAIRRMPLAPLLSRMWSLRDQLTAYDAAYVALAEMVDAPVLTCDVKMTRATQARCEWELLA